MTEEDFKRLDVKAMSIGNGRKASDAELIDYLSGEIDVEPLDLEVAFCKSIKA